MIFEFEISSICETLNSLSCRKGKKPLEPYNIQCWFKNARAALRRRVKTQQSEVNVNNGTCSTTNNSSRLSLSRLSTSNSTSFASANALLNHDDYDDVDLSDDDVDEDVDDGFNYDRDEDAYYGKQTIDEHEKTDNVTDERAVQERNKFGSSILNASSISNENDDGTQSYYDYDEEEDANFEKVDQMSQHEQSKADRLKKSEIHDVKQQLKQSSNSRRNRIFIDPISEVPILEEHFKKETYPDHYLIEKICSDLNRGEYRRKYPKLESRNIQLWFKNHRAKVKRLVKSEISFDDSQPDERQQNQQKPKPSSTSSSMCSMASGSTSAISVSPSSAGLMSGDLIESKGEHTLQI